MADCKKEPYGKADLTASELTILRWSLWDSCKPDAVIQKALEGDEFPESMMVPLGDWEEAFKGVEVRPMWSRRHEELVWCLRSDKWAPYTSGEGYFNVASTLNDAMEYARLLVARACGLTLNEG